MGNQKIELRGTLICQDEAEAAIVRAELPEHIRLTHLEAACELFEVVESEDPLRWIVHELFSDREGFEAHQARVRVSQWGQRTAHIARDYTITEVPAAS